MEEEGWADRKWSQHRMVQGSVGGGAGDGGSSPVVGQRVWTFLSAGDGEPQSVSGGGHSCVVGKLVARVVKESEGHA